MASSPLRPFVPQRTPTRPRPAVSSAEFRLARPFVPGAEANRGETIQSGPASHGSQEPPPSLQSIQDFLHRETGSPKSTPFEATRHTFAAESDEASAELPPLEHFLDPLPEVGEFEAAPSGSVDAPWPDSKPAAAPPPAASETPASEWGITDWQQYDWRSVAALGEAVESAASNAWDTTDWDATGQRSALTPRKGPPTAAQAIASALNQIAQRIKDGELAVPMPGAATDPAELSRTLAALLGIRQ